MPSDLHEQKVSEFLHQLTQDGWRTFNLRGKIPDGIAVKDGKVVAIEVLRRYHNKNGKQTFSGNTSIVRKKSAYSMFDEVIVETFLADLPKKAKRDNSFAKARLILNPI